MKITYSISITIQEGDEFVTVKIFDGIPSRKEATSLVDSILNNYVTFYSVELSISGTGYVVAEYNNKGELLL